MERLLLSHPDISDLAVVGLDDPVWGQKVAAVIVPTSPEAEISVQKVKVSQIEKRVWITLSNVQEVVKI